MNRYTHSTHNGFPTIQRSAIVRFDTKNSIGNVVPAQNTSNATATVVHAGSFMCVRRVV